MTKTRSPNYPSIDLETAIAAVEPVYRKEGRNSMAKEVLATHLGYSSINGRSLSMIGALRGYGLIDGRGDENRVSEDAITIINAPGSSLDFADALIRSAYRPTLFSELKSQFPQGASSENVRYALVKRQFTPEAAAKAAETYASNFIFLSGLNPTIGSPAANPGTPTTPSLPIDAAPKDTTPKEVRRMTAHQGERELMSGGLSGDARFRLIVSGAVGSKELARLIKKLEMEKEIAEEAEAQAASDHPPKEGVFN